MVMAATFTGVLSLVCQMQQADVAFTGPVRIDVRDGAAEISGLEDMAFARGAIANRGQRGGLRLVAVAARDPEADIWAELTPSRRRAYALALYSVPHGVSGPRSTWGRGQCQREGTAR